MTDSPPPPDCDPVGTVEIAKRFDVGRKAVDAWRTRGLGFPAPKWTVGGRPCWNWPDVEAWGYANRRPPAHPTPPTTEEP